MPTATITPAYVNQPAPGKKEGSIKLKDGSFYGVPPAMLSQLQPNNTYEVEFTEREWNGKIFRSIKSAKLVSAGQYGQTDNKTAERIFVCGALNAAIHGGHVQVTPETLTQAVNDLRQVWASTFGNKQKADDLNDEIPY